MMAAGTIQRQRLLRQCFLPVIFLLAILLDTTTTCDAYSLDGKRAFVTGSSGGIGRGIALALAGEGCTVLIHYHVRKTLAETTAEEIRDKYGTDRVAGIVQCDFRNNDEIRNLMKEIGNDEIGWGDNDDGGFDILINNAGMVTKQALEDDDDNLSKWYETMQVNLNAPRLLSHLSVPRMRRRERNNGDGDDGGVIVNVSSIHSEKSNEYMSAYAVSKAGLDALTRSMAMEYGEYNIRVNSVNPGIVAVERTADAFKDEAVLKSWTDRMPIPRLGRPDDIGQAVLQLVQNDWITGSIWQIDGGMMARSNYPPRDRPPKIVD